MMVLEGGYNKFGIAFTGLYNRTTAAFWEVSVNDYSTIFKNVTKIEYAVVTMSSFYGSLMVANLFNHSVLIVNSTTGKLFYSFNLTFPGEEIVKCVSVYPRIICANLWTMGFRSEV